MENKWDEEDEFAEWYFDEDDEDIDEWPPCSRCGPICEHWGGDGLCMLQIASEARESEYYHKKFTQENVQCPVCKKLLIRHDVPMDELYVWPGYISPMIGLEVYSAYDVPKEVLHVSGNEYHIKIHSGKTHEKIIRLIGKKPELAHKWGNDV